jgi:hypothetical protein
MPSNCAARIVFTDHFVGAVNIWIAFQILADLFRQRPLLSDANTATVWALQASGRRMPQRIDLVSACRDVKIHELARSRFVEGC